MRRHIPNALTASRIACIPVLVWCVITRAETLFTVLLIYCLVGDVVDGILARALHATSPLGAMLDSIADAMLFFTAVAGAVVFHPETLYAHPVAFALIPGLWVAQIAVSLVRYGRLSSFHTRLSRIAAYALGFLIGLLFLSGLQPWLLYLCIALVVLDAIEQFALLWLLPTWTPDVRSVWWLLRTRRANGSEAS